jgi:SAM-dependent methyltransferase
MSRSDTRSFYQTLMSGEAKRGLWGKESRFNADKIIRSPSVLGHFERVISRYVEPTHRCLDLGCGSGGFLTILAGKCGHAVGADIVPAFVEEARNTLERHGRSNAEVVLLQQGKLPFADGEFDRLLMVDTIHHLENVQETLDEAARVLRPGGLLLVFEPNKLNPLLALMCLFDPNEQGLLRLGTFDAYERILSARFEVVARAYNGLLVGPSGRLARGVADFVSRPARAMVNWFSPKIFIAAARR